MLYGMLQALPFLAIMAIPTLIAGGIVLAWKRWFRNRNRRSPLTSELLRPPGFGLQEKIDEMEAVFGGGFKRARAELGVESVEVRRVATLGDVDGLIIPGGESTTLLNLMEDEPWFDALRAFHARGGALFGTCAGAILLSREVVHPAARSAGNASGAGTAQTIHAAARGRGQREAPVAVEGFARGAAAEDTREKQRRGRFEHGRGRAAQRVGKADVGGLFAKADGMRQAGVGIELDDEMRRAAVAAKTRVDAMEDSGAAGHQAGLGG